MNRFHPPHIYRDNAIYFVTGRTVGGKEYFNLPGRKQIFLKVLNLATMKFGYKMFAFVINDNHYHILFSADGGLPFGEDSKQEPSCAFIAGGKKSGASYHMLAAFINNLHSNSARLINAADKNPGRKVWYQYWDRCVRSERDFWTRFSYIHQNPIKHGYFEDFGGLRGYKFCSYYLWLRKNGREWLDSAFENYPIKDFILGHED